MLDSNNSRFSSALIMTLIWSSGCLVGFTAQRIQSQIGSEAPAVEMMNGAAAGTVISNSKPDTVPSPESLVGVLSDYVYFNGGMVSMDGHGGILITPLKSVTGVDTSRISSDTLLTMLVPGLVTSEILSIGGEDSFY